MNYLKIALIVGLCSFTAFIGYRQGRTDGWEAYRHSNQFKLTMRSMYLFGWWDAKVYNRYDPPPAPARERSTPMFWRLSKTRSLKSRS